MFFRVLAIIGASGLIGIGIAGALKFLVEMSFAGELWVVIIGVVSIIYLTYTK